MIEKSLTFERICATICSLNRGADEHKYPRAVLKRTETQSSANGKGYLRRSAKLRSIALGIRENTRVTVTVREVLFKKIPRKGIFFCLFKAGTSPFFSYHLVSIFTFQGV